MRENNFFKKRGVSPVVATVLLISLVLIIALIIFLWFRGMTEESITKFGGKNVKLVCQDVEFEADYSGGELYIKNTGNVPIFQIKMKIISEGSHTTETLEQGWPEVGLNQGKSYSGSVSFSSSVQEIILIPVLVGKSKEGEKKSSECDENYGHKITL